MLMDLDFKLVDLNDALKRYDEDQKLIKTTGILTHEISIDQSAPGLKTPLTTEKQPVEVEKTQTPVDVVDKKIEEPELKIADPNKLAKETVAGEITEPKTLDAGAKTTDAANEDDSGSSIALIGGIVVVLAAIGAGVFFITKK
jgi:hypothetical protein